MGFKKITLLSALFAFLIAPAISQEAEQEKEVFNINKLPEELWPAESRVKEKNKQQLDDYIEGKTVYPPRQRHMPTIGLSGGLGYVNGDVKSRLGWGTGLFVRHNIGYLLSLRYEANFLQTYGQNIEPRSLKGDLMNNPDQGYRNSAYNGRNGVKNYRDFGINLAYDNYKTDIVDLGADVILNFGNILIHKPDNRVNIYGGVGVGAMLYRTMVDAFDENDDPYPYRDIRADIISQGLEGKDIRSYLNDNYYEKDGDRTYETYGEGQDPEETGFFQRQMNSVIRLSIGVEFLLGEKKRFALGLEHRANFVGDDLLDGVRWSDQGDFTPQYDTYHYTNLKLGINLGSKDKRTSPMWWTNPVALYARKYEAPGDRFQDSDGDGIDDKYDLEENTKVDCPVDAKGRLLDSDGDGCPDCEDPEPFSTPLLPIVDCKNVYAGFASKECCDEKALLVPAKDKCADVVLPSVSFDYDRFGMGTGSYASLEQIAKTMQDCPDLKVVVNGVTNTTKNVKYNEQLSWLRTNEAVEHLVEKYGISRDRFIVTYQGANIKSEGGDFDKFQNNKVEFKAAGAGVTGSSNPPAPHPGYKAGRP
jgi:OOP family OmpA-OmpF porin